MLVFQVVCEIMLHVHVSKSGTKSGVASCYLHHVVCEYERTYVYIRTRGSDVHWQESHRVRPTTFSAGQGLAHSLSHSPTRSLLTQSLSHSVTHPLTHSFTHCEFFFWCWSPASVPLYSGHLTRSITRGKPADIYIDEGRWKSRGR